MSNYATLIESIQSVITQNGNNEITGTILQQTLLSMINSLGSGYQFVGIATPETNPGTPDQRVFYLASSGTYPNFGPATIPVGNLAVFYYDTSWHYSLCKITEQFASGEEVNSTHIMDSVSNGASTDVLSAKQGMALNSRLGQIDLTETKVSVLTDGVGQNVYNGYINGSNGNYESSSYNSFIVVVLGGADKVRWLGKNNTSNTSHLGWAFGTFSGEIDSNLSNFVPILGGIYENDANGNKAVEYIQDVPDGATHAVITIWRYQSGSTSAVTLDNFYCYLQYGSTVVDELEGKVNRSDLSEYEYVVKNLFDKSSYKIGYYVLSLSGGEVANSNGIMSQKLNLEDGVPYILSKIMIGGTGTTKYARLCIYNNEDTLIGVKIIPGTITYTYDAGGYYKYEGKANFVHEKTEGEAYCRIVIQYNVNESGSTNYAQLEVGTGEPTAYASYNEIHGYRFGNEAEINGRIGTLEEQVASLSKEMDDISTIEEGLRYVEGTSVVDSDTEISSSYYYGTVGMGIKTKSSVSTFRGKRYIVQGGESYYFSNKFGSGIYSDSTPIYGLIFTDSNGVVLGRYFLATKNTVNEWKDVSIEAPDDAAYAYVNYHTGSVSYTDFLTENEYGYIDVLSMKQDIDTLQEGSGNADRSLMKVVINDNSFFVRTKFSASEDIAINFAERTLSNSSKGSQSLTLNSYYLGSNELTDAQLVSSDHKFANDPDDTISAISFVGFGPMTGQHGWSIARVTKTSGITVDENDIGSVWADKDNRSRTFVLGYITSNYIYFFPQTTYDEDNGIYGTTTGAVFNNLPSGFVYVSGEASHTQDINASAVRYDLRIETTEWEFLVDGHKVGNGTYYCDDFIFTEKVKGHNPVGVSYSDWINNNGDDKYVNPDFVYLCRSYVFKGASMTYNLSFNTLYPFKLNLFYFLHPMLPIAVSENDKTYHANLFVPKCKGISTPYTNDSGMESGKSYPKYRRSSDLYDVNDLPDRAIAFLKASEDDYKIGMAGGYSLVNGITQKETRNTLLINLLNNTDIRLCHFGNSSSSKNKFYTQAFVGSSFESSIVPTSFVKDLSGYVCWFNPNTNPGMQVYTYKDSDCHVVYVHAQAASNKSAVTLPDYLEGMSVSEVVEKTNGSTLLTDKVTCGKIYVKFEQNYGNTYSTNDNYIVLKLR